MRRLLVAVPIFLFCLSSLALFPAAASAQPKEFQPSTISGGAAASSLAPRLTDLSGLKGSPDEAPLGPSVFIPGVGFLAYNFDNNATETGGYIFIPPDPIGSAGLDRVLAVVNVGIECRTKTGTLIFRDALKDFFSALGGQTLGTFCFDPKVVYDHYENRFVVVALERWLTAYGDPSDESRILVAVSKTSSPATATSSDWWYLAINSKISINSNDHWADYPGFEVDEEAVYITANMFPYTTGSGGVRLWIIDKGVASGFYAGGTPSWNVYDPIPGGGSFYDMTMMPALVFGAGGVGTGIGTFLVGYSGLTNGGPGAVEWVQIVRVDDPLGVSGGPSFNGEFVSLGDLEDVGGGYGWPDLVDAPQNGTSSLIEVNDRRSLDAVWRNNNLWVTTTIDPNTGYDATNNGQATAHWFRFDTSAIPSPITLADQGNIGGEDIATDTWTFFPAVAVNGNGDAEFGFAASAASIYCGAYMAGRHPTDTPGTVQASGTVQAGLDYYLRTFGGTKNRWGDFSGASVDPSDDNTFWIFNQYAETRGTGTPPEDGRWGTAWKSSQPMLPTDFGDAPDPLYPTLLASNGARHQIVAGVFMGLLIDAEPDGQPHPNALGDDINLSADEDGVALPLPLIPGQSSQIDVTVSVAGWVDIWIDFNKNGSWLDAGDKVAATPVVAGLNMIPINVPMSALPGTTFMRVRYNIGGIVLAPTGPASDGEVEDHLIPIEEPQDLDFGDAPDGPYPTVLANNGARHAIVAGINMGALIDAELDGQPDASATGDDLANQPDEDGVVFVTPLVPGFSAQIDVSVTAPGYLDVWIDFDQNGSWLDPIDIVFTSPVVAGVNPIFFTVPAAALSGTTFGRFRYNTAGPVLPTGSAPDGEVEDYRVTVEQLDFGDAPDGPYPTLLASNGARHGMVYSLWMGAQRDAEPDGLQDPAALGDDTNNLPDEDGVVFTSPLDPTKPATVDVTVTQAGLLDAWIDFDNNGAWDPYDQIFASQALVAGTNSLTFIVPPTGKAAPGFDTFARFRVSSGGGLQPTGAALDGEVEDYRVHIEDDVVTGANDNAVPERFALHNAVPNPFNPQTTLSFSLPTASHVRLTIYDVRGHLVTTLVDEDRGPGVHDVVWNGRDARNRQVASGVYLYRIEAGSFIETKRMVLVK